MRELQHDKPLALLLTPRETAKALGVSERTLFSWRETEGLPFVQVGRTIRYPLADLQRWAEARTQGGAL